MEAKMKKLLTYLLMALLVSTAAFAASVSRSMPLRLDPGSTLTVAFQIEGTTPNEAFAIEDKLPSSWTVADWSVTGAKEAKAQITTRFQAPLFAWSFTPSGTSATLSYTVTLPSTEGTYTFDAVWFDRSGQSRSTQSLQVRPIKCGDGMCEGAENSDSCIQDCPVATTITVPGEFVTTTLEIEQGPPRNFTWLWILAIAVAVLLLLYFILKKKHESPQLPKI
jgi:hypothetical protein